MSLLNVLSGADVSSIRREGFVPETISLRHSGSEPVLWSDRTGPVRSDHMYWTEPWPDGNVRRARLDGTEQQILFRGLPAPTGIDLDLASGLTYWANYDGGEIRRANLDGTDQTTLVKGQVGPGGLALDLAGGQMYWCNVDGGNIRRANLDGSKLTTLVRGLNQPRVIALDLAGGLMYWTNYGSRDIRRANLEVPGKRFFSRAGLALMVSLSILRAARCTGPNPTPATSAGPTSTAPARNCWSGA